MDTNQILGLLIEQRDRLNGAIAALEGKAGPSRKGTASAALNKSVEGKGARKGRTPAQKRAQSEKMRAYWASKRAATHK